LRFVVAISLKEELKDLTFNFEKQKPVFYPGEEFVQWVR